MESIADSEVIWAASAAQNVIVSLFPIILIVRPCSIPQYFHRKLPTHNLVVRTLILPSTSPFPSLSVGALGKPFVPSLVPSGT